MPIPTHVRFKEFDFGIYRFVPPTTAASEMAIDVGDEDDLQVVRFHAKERDQRGTYRWTRGLSYLSLVGLPADGRELVLWMDNGGRPAQAPPAEVEAFIGEVSLGRVAVGPGMHPYALPIPPQVAGRGGRLDRRRHRPAEDDDLESPRGAPGQRRPRPRCYGGPRGDSPRALTAARRCSITSISTRRASAGRSAWQMPD